MAELDDDPDGEVVIATEVDAAGDPIVVLSGEVDMSNASSLSAAVATITATPPSRLTFDLTACASSTVPGSLSWCQRRPGPP